VARRRYRSDAISQAGHAEKPRDPQTVAEEFPAGSEPTAPTASPRAEYGKPEPEPAQAKPDISNLKAQVDAQRAYAEQRARVDPLDAYIAHYFGGASPAERQWLRANPHHLNNPMLIHHAAAIALQHVPRESPEFLHFVGQLLDQHHAAMQAQAAPAAPMPPPVPPPMPSPMTHVDLEKTEGPEGEPESASVSARYSAPVSRASEHFSGDYEPGDGSRVTLSKAEREHAEAAHVSVEEYARQKMKMLKLKKAKVIKDE
jgi:hypothetical protein